MGKSKIRICTLAAVAGAALLLVGLFVLTTEQVKAWSGLCIGVGAAALSLGIGNLLDALLVSKAENERIAHRKSIEVNDERNIRIREKAGATVNRITVFAQSALVLALGLMRADRIVILMASSILLLDLVLAVVLTNYYSRTL